MIRRVVVLALLCPAVARAQDAATVDFARQIAPILAKHCVECHGAKKQKGDLRLDARAFAFATTAERDVAVVVAGDPDASELIRRITLPADDDDVMPPKGEPLPPEQQQLLRSWVLQGAAWPPAGDAALAAAAITPPQTFVLPPIDDAARQRIDAAAAALRQSGASVLRIAAGTDALDVSLAPLGARATDADVERLLVLAPVLVSLDLSRTAITDVSAPQLARLVQLRRLHVAETRLGDRTFTALQPLCLLQQLNAHGTALGDAALADLVKLPKLERIYAWGTRATPAGVQALDPKLRGRIHLGGDNEVLLAAVAREQPINTECPVAGKPIDPAHTLEHEGRRVGFCCAKCKQQFANEPARYVDKLPPAVRPQ